MKKFYAIIFMLAVLGAAGFSQSLTRSTSIGTNFTSHAPMTFTAADKIITSDSLVISIKNPQKYYQHQTATATLATVSGSPSVVITLRGRVNSTDNWHPIGTPVTWTEAANNPVVITSTDPHNYNELKVSFVGSGAEQESKITAFDIKTANLLEVPSSAGTLTISRPTAGAIALTVKDNDANAALTVKAGGTGALTLGQSTGATTITSSGTVAVTASNVEIGATSANETTPSLKIIGDADSDAGGDTDEALTVDLTANATPANAVWDVTSTQSAGYRFDKSLTVGLATPNETLPKLAVRGDADSDAGDDTSEELSVVLTPNATATSAVWDITSTQSAGYRFDKALAVGPATADDVRPTLKVQGDADSDAAQDTQEALTVTLSANATPTLATWGFTSTQSAGYTFDKGVTVSAGVLKGNPMFATIVANTDESETLTAAQSGVLVTTDGAATITIPDPSAATVGVVYYIMQTADANLVLTATTADSNSIICDGVATSDQVTIDTGSHKIGAGMIVIGISATKWYVGGLNPESVLTPEAAD